MNIVKISLLGIAGVLFALPLKSYKPVFGILLSLGTCICIFTFILNRLGIVISYVDSLKNLLPIDNYYFEIILKMIGITYISEFASGLCRDSGYREIASQIEMFAKLSILVVSMPVFMAFIETIGEFV